MGSESKEVGQGGMLTIACANSPDMQAKRSHDECIARMTFASV